MEIKTILVIEDDEGIRRMMVSILRYFGYQNVLQAEDGEEGIDMVRRHNPDLVITDLVMPKVRGEQVVEFVKGEYLVSFPRAKVIVVSGEHPEDSERSVIALGADGFVAKPFNPNTLKDLVERLLTEVKA